MATDADRREELRRLREAIKARAGLTYGDIARQSGKSVGWVGVCLRGGYPWHGACLLPVGIRRTLENRGFAVPECLRGFDADTSAVGGSVEQ